MLVLPDMFQHGSSAGSQPFPDQDPIENLESILGSPIRPLNTPTEMGGSRAFLWHVYLCSDLARWN